MAELATIARPYAEALFKAAGNADVKPLVEQLDAVAAVAADAQLRSFADNPKVTAQQVFDLITDFDQAAASRDATLAEWSRRYWGGSRLIAVPRETDDGSAK